MAPEERRRHPRYFDRLAKIVNSLLSEDDGTRQRLRELTGCVVEFRLRGSDLSLFVTVEDGELVFTNSVDTEVDVEFEGSVADFLVMARTRENNGKLAAGRVQIRGDLAVAQQIQTLLAAASIDWEELIAIRFGDVPARQFGRLVRGGLDQLRNVQSVLERDFAEYLNYELRAVPSERELTGFLQACQDLARDVDRLAERVERLIAKRPAR